MPQADIAQWILCAVLVLSSLGVVLVQKPVHACLCFLLTLISLAAIYLQLSAQFIAIMQVLVYAGAILVIFMFVIVLFQDAYQQIAKFKAKSSPVLLTVAAVALSLTLAFLATKLLHLPQAAPTISDNFGAVQSLGRALYIDFFFPFEAVILLFLIAVVGSVYVAKKVK